MPRPAAYRPKLCRLQRDDDEDDAGKPDDPRALACLHLKWAFLADCVVPCNCAALLAALVQPGFFLKHFAVKGACLRHGLL